MIDNQLIIETAKGITNLAQANAGLRQTLQEILDEAQSSLPVDGMYANKLQFYQAKMRRIAAMASAALSGEEVIE